MDESSTPSPGVAFPVSGQGRSTSAFGRAVVADALRPVDAVGARAAETDTNWRRGYLTHFRRLVEAGLPSRDSALAIARGGLAAAHGRMCFVAADGTEIGLGEAIMKAPAATSPIETVSVTGTGEPETELSLPYHGERLTGDALHRRLDAWVEGGFIEPSCADAVRTVMRNPEWLRLAGRRVAILGAGAEMGPLYSLLRWGAEVLALDLPRADVWQRVLGIVRERAGTVHVPIAGSAGGARSLEHRAGVDLLTQLPDIAAWLLELDGPYVLGNYVYADGATNVRVSMAVDALTTFLQERRDDVALAFLGTPTDVYAVPREVVEFSANAYARRGALKTLRQPLRAASAGRLLRRNYAPTADPGVNDSLVPQQGPNYALAKRLQRWRATVARESGSTVSFHVAPATRTRSVVKNRVLAAAYAGSRPFGIEVFEPATSNTLMAALLVHDLHAVPAPQAHPWQDEAYASAHGGLWRSAYDPRSALGLAVVLGMAGARG